MKSKMRETHKVIKENSFLPNVPSAKPKIFQSNMSSFLTEVNEKVVSLDEYRQRLKDVDINTSNHKKGKIYMKKPQRVKKKYSSKFAKANTRRSIANYLCAMSNKDKSIPNPYVAQLIQKENYKTKIEELKEKHKSMSEIPPIRHHSNFNRYHYISNKSLDMIFDDAPSHIKQNSYSNSLTGNLSDFMSNHVELSHQLRQLDYDNNKVNSLLKTEKNQIVKISKKINNKIKAFHWKYLMTENEKELLPENNFYNQNEEPIQLTLSASKQLSRMIQNLKTVQTEEANEIIQKNYKKGS